MTASRALGRRVLRAAIQLGEALWVYLCERLCVVKNWRLVYYRFWARRDHFAVGWRAVWGGRSLANSRECVFNSNREFVFRVLYFGASFFITDEFWCLHSVLYVGYNVPWGLKTIITTGCV